jgi:hypothetical protein
MKLFTLILFFCLASKVAAQEQLTPREQQLLDAVEKLQARVAALEAKLGAEPVISTSVNPPAPKAITTEAAANPAPAAPPPNLLTGTTVSGELDAYYGFNFNQPIGRDNLLRAFDVSSNSFSLSQADLILENAADPDKGKRWGMRVDLQFGQATQTLQGNPTNEPRPEIYRDIFQAYGTYVFPAGKGLTLDFGKWSSSLGIEGNYGKDQINYSRSFWFDYLPFYHMGARAQYKLTDNFTLNYWVTNGTQQTEAFNNFKDELWGWNYTPTKNVSWTFNYYLGQEHPDVIFYNNGNVPSSNLPTLQGTPFAPIPGAPHGHLEIFDSYVLWQLTPALTLATDGDYVIQRLYTNSAPAHALGGASYLRYQLSPKWALAARAEYLSDRGGLFSGATQALKEQTVPMEYKVIDGFLVRGEWRRDASNHPYFLTDTLGLLKKEQNTATLGLVWWFGGKSGAW